MDYLVREVKCWEGRFNYKEEGQGYFGGDGIVLYLHCGGG